MIINNSLLKAKNLQDYQELGKVFGYIGKFQINKSTSKDLVNL